jgi:hypothetical protein
VTTIQARVKRMRLPLLPACLAAIVLGILGMHGLSRHGAMPSHADPRPVAAVTAETGTHGGQAAMNDAATVTSNQIGTVTLAAGDTGGSAGHIAVLCAAMVLAAAAGVLLVLRLRRLAHGTVRNLRARLLAVRTFVVHRLDNGPPAVWEFSVVRC